MQHVKYTIRNNIAKGIANVHIIIIMVFWDIKANEKQRQQNKRVNVKFQSFPESGIDLKSGALPLDH